MGQLDRFDRCAATEHLQPHVGGNRIHHVAAAGDDRMDPDVVLVAKGLAHRVDAGQRHARRGQRIDALVGRATGVAGATKESDELGHHAIVGAAHGQVAILRPRGRVDHHRGIHVVECAQADHLGLAAQELELALRPETRAALRARRTPRRARRSMRPGPRAREPLRAGRGRAEHHRQLRIVAAGVHGARAGIPVGVLPAQQ